MSRAYCAIELLDTDWGAKRCETDRDHWELRHTESRVRACVSVRGTWHRLRSKTRVHTESAQCQWGKVATTESARLLSLSCLTLCCIALTHLGLHCIALHYFALHCVACSYFRRNKAPLQFEFIWWVILRCCHNLSSIVILQFINTRGRSHKHLINAPKMRISSQWNYNWWQYN